MPKQTKSRWLVVFVNISTINFLKGHGLEKEQEKFYRRVWREKMKGKNHVIALKISKTKIKQKKSHQCIDQIFKPLCLEAMHCILGSKQLG